MNNEEKYIRERVGQGNPFRVPDGYFDRFTAQVMASLPERKPKSRFAMLRPWLYAAASLLFAVSIGTTLYFQQAPSDGSQIASTTEASFMDDMADYAMFDNAEIYACLSDN